MMVGSPCFVVYENDDLARLSLDFLKRAGCQTLSVSEDEFLPSTLKGATVVRIIPKDLTAPMGWSTRRAVYAKLVRFRGSFTKLLSRQDPLFEHLVPVWHQEQVGLLVGIRFDAQKRIKKNPERFEQALRQAAASLQAEINRLDRTRRNYSLVHREWLD